MVLTGLSHVLSCQNTWDGMLQMATPGQGGDQEQSKDFEGQKTTVSFHAYLYLSYVLILEDHLCRKKGPVASFWHQRVISHERLPLHGSG